MTTFFDIDHEHLVTTVQEFFLLADTSKQPTVSELVPVVLFFAIFWVVIFRLIAVITRPFLKGQPWMIRTAEREYFREGKEMNEKMGCPISKEDFVDNFQFMWPWVMGLVLQHLAGGLLCIPSAFKLLGFPLATRLAWLSILSELGWEIEDMLGWLHKRFFEENGARKAPTTILVALALHHSLACCLGIPMILQYGTSRLLHTVVMDLQLGAGITIGIAEYTKLLDVTVPSQLLQFKVLTCFALIVAMWTRVIHWTMLLGQLYLEFYNDAQWNFLIVGVLIGSFFTLFSFAVVVMPLLMRFIKFMKKSAAYETLQKDTKATEASRRTSMLELQAAASAVLSTQSDDWMPTFLPQNAPERRKSAPMVNCLTFRRSSAILTRGASIPAHLRFSFRQKSARHL